MSKRKLVTYQVTITETLRYAVKVKAFSEEHAERLGTDLWHEQMQLFRCISDGGIDVINIEKIGGDK
jgi:hypothetical protein